MKKLFTLAAAVLASLTMWAGTETTTNTGSSNTDVTMTSFTIKGTYVAGKGNTKTTGMPNAGIKVRLNRTSTEYPSSDWGKTSKNFEVSVNDNYKITAFTIYCNDNDGSKTATLDKIYVDGVEYTGSYGKTWPANSSSNACLTINLTSIEATKAISFNFSDITGNQGIVVCSATYEQLVECTDPEIAWEIEPANGTVGAADFLASVTTTPADHAVTWTSSVEAVATVTDGTIHYVGAGVTAITASLEYTGDDYCKKTVSVSKNISVPITYEAAGENDKIWYYQSAAPSAKPDNGLNYDQTLSKGGLYGIKLNSSGYAWFVKPEGAGTLRIGAYSPDLNAAYEVYAYACNASGEKSGDPIGTLSTPYAGGVSNTIDINADVAGIRLERKTNNEGVLYFIEYRGEAPCAATVPGDIAKGALSAGVLTLTAAGSPAEGDVWYWQDAADGTDKTEEGASKQVSAAGTYYIRSYNEAGDCWSSAKSCTVEATDLVETYTVVYKDGETELGRETVEVGKHPTASAITTTKDFYTFKAWQLNADDVELSAVSGAKDETVTLTARYGDPKYATTADFVEVVSEAPSIDDFLSASNIKATGLGSKSTWEETTKVGFNGYKVKAAGAVISFLVQAGKHVSILLGSVGADATLNKGGEVSTIDRKKGDDVTTTIPTFTPTADMVVSLTTNSSDAETVTLKLIYIETAWPTALDNTDAANKAIKTIENGQIVIIKNGVRYNVLGAVLK